MRWALAFHPDQIMRSTSGRNRLMVAPIHLPEDQITIARGQGWIVLGADSDVYPCSANTELNMQSNPRRRAEIEGDGA